MEKIKVKLPDNSVLEVDKGTTPLQIAEILSKRLAKDAVAAKVNGVVIDLTRPLEEDCELQILTFDDPEGREVFWHSSAHLMAHAIEELFPGAKFGVGPPIEDGFYYDVDVDKPLTVEDLAKIEEKMKELAQRDEPYVRKVVTKEEALEFFKKKGDPYKVEIIEQIEDNDIITLYSEGSFTDLCRGPHLPSTGKIKYVKLLSIAGAYWRGDAKNKMLQRVYGVAYPKKELLDEHLRRLEEAKKRDHRRLGKELELFVFHDIAPGAPFWLPKGMIIFRELEKFIREELDKRGYEEISTPILVKKDLWEKSGHWEHYKENMFVLEVEDEIYSLKPMNCPESTYVYKMRTRSYRDLPLRLAEIGRLHRNEISGALGGMFRVRQITMDDAHIYCRPDQILNEINELIDFINYVYGIFKFQPAYYLSTKPDNAMGDPALWEQAEQALKMALEQNGIKYGLKEKEGAFYGPKIDVQIKDALGRDWQVATIQLDFVMLPERFDLTYIDVDGQPKRPVAIHRAIFGSFERFVGILTEHFAGNFPVWLAPVQVAVLPITDAQNDYAKTIWEKLKQQKIRAEIDLRNEKITYKIREAETKKIPYMLIIGEKERTSGTVSIRRHGKGDLGVFDLESFISRIKFEIESKVVE
ncbi:threonyl-tRNA synthetase [Candidatus Kryptonium thompsonii]|uniref:Threonine--tRNA ligase n=2 Tax=Candidatus Kryptonium thompsonii TaxID=1633631 RepID=A0A0N7MQX5_9BACT|nr:threonine--tRNA ligase [Candidatus Kryptonium thompsoni]CUS77966.1 threonyl-tRNA synthetase [Candidatus Kryptonium thompsoni]CUS83059.1 threonyl-tRNA synthetase [Candidatus Kryptonium thompsoni]CUS83807.1 threonyl-tRNA synthetase [Candidatus Kryptonium thompsoni]CUS87114.1 threonyl-tRNA synthetase [Candidatus Kryptonium thompsoni]CUS94155.1 threonyl-tRNA synthetase [Candidatus Kryptonium thompsoni]